MTEPKPCQYCSGEKTLYQKTYSTKLYLAAFGSRRVLVTECMQCPPHAKCCKRGRPATSAFLINYCPEFKGLLAPKCAKYGICDEMRPCEEGRRLQYGNDSSD